MAIALDATCGNGSQSQTSISASLNHAAMVLIAIAVGYDHASNSVSSVTVGGVSATLMQTGPYSCSTDLYSIFRSSAANETVTVTMANNNCFEFTASSFTGTKTTSPYWECLVTGPDGTANSDSISVAAGTTGRRVYYALCANGGNNPDSPPTWGGGQTQLDWERVYWSRWTGSSYKDTADATTMSASWTYSNNKGGVAGAILPVILGGPRFLSGFAGL